MFRSPGEPASGGPFAVRAAPWKSSGRVESSCAPGGMASPFSGSPHWICPAIRSPKHRRGRRCPAGSAVLGPQLARGPPALPTCAFLHHLCGPPTLAQHPRSGAGAVAQICASELLFFSHLRTAVSLCLGGTSGAGRARRGLTPGEHAAGRAPGYAPARLAQQENRAVIRNKNTLEQQWKLHLQVKRTFSKRREDSRRGAAAHCLFMRQPVSPAL